MKPMPLENPPARVVALAPERPPSSNIGCRRRYGCHRHPLTLLAQQPDTTGTPP
jgi:hypothetical protein